MINKGLQELFFGKEEFEGAKRVYSLALKDSGYKQTLSYEKSTQKKESKRRKRNIIWFNPPFNKTVKTKIDSAFLHLVKKHFPKHHKLSKIFNRNTLKLSYSYTTNMANNVKKHDSKIVNDNTEKNQPMCNCRKNTTCPLNGNCQAKCLVYKASVRTSIDTHVYYGQCEGNFKTRFNNHTKSFKHRKYENETELSKQIWMLKDSSTKFDISWSILARTHLYKSGSNRCALCLAEKTAIIRANPRALLNKRIELISKCCHRNKFLLCNLN